MTPDTDNPLVSPDAGIQPWTEQPSFARGRSGRPCRPGDGPACRCLPVVVEVTGAHPPPPPDFPDDWENYDENGNYSPAGAEQRQLEHPAACAADVHPRVRPRLHNPNDPTRAGTGSDRTLHGVRAITLIRTSLHRTLSEPLKSARSKTARCVNSTAHPAERRGQRVNGALDTTPLATAWNRLNAVGSAASAACRRSTATSPTTTTRCTAQGQVTQDASGA